MISIIPVDDSRKALWDAYVKSHYHASVYHLYAFKQAVEKTYGHKSLYFAAFDTELDRFVGVLPLFYISSFIFGTSLVSIPFCDYGGLLYDDEQYGRMLYEKALSLFHETRATVLELRQTYTVPFVSGDQEHDEIIGTKVRMKLALPVTSEELFASFPAKLRSQIRKPQKDGCIAKSGGRELLDDFYSVFVYNMRDLGSPVHPKKMMADILEAYGADARIFVVYKEGKPIACSLVAGLNKALVNPWASFNKNYRASAPNMLLYWSMMEYAIANGYSTFDFGRSTKDEGTYRFKEQWGALPEPLLWYYRYRLKKPIFQTGDGKNKKRFIAAWQKLPLGITRVLGPILRRQIPL
jgi:FemAB-related protein (PEP-CTERM system-associated)